MTDDQILNALTDRTDEILKKLVEPIIKYQKTQDGLYAYDVSKDEAYRRNFASFYKLSRRKAEWKDHYFSLLESSKNDPNVRFDNVIRELQARMGRVEPSFSSKLVATINPQQPVIDSIVLGILDYKQPNAYRADRVERLIDLHEKLTNRLDALTQDSRFKSLKKKFMTNNPDCRFTDIKILDLLMWQLR